MLFINKLGAIWVIRLLEMSHCADVCLLLDALLTKVAFRSSVTALLPDVWFSSLMSTPESKLVSRLSTGLRLLCCSDTA